MLKKEVEYALNTQMNAELASAYVYFAMSAYFEAQGLKGFAGWLRQHAKEELEHAGKIYTYVVSRSGALHFDAIAAPHGKWNSPLAIFEEALSREKAVTAAIDQLVDLTMKSSDHATHNFLQWFVSEQVEEEATVSDIVNQLKLVKSDSGALFMLDRDLGAKAVAPEA
jgi:ferritin